MQTPLRLGLLWWFTLGGLGLFFPYFSLYLRENLGLRGAELGLALAIPPLIGLISQPFWGQISDRSGRRARTLTWITLGTSLGYLAVGHAKGFWPLLACTAGLALFSTAVVPNCVAVTLSLASDGRSFGRARVMGTLSFGVSVTSLPYLLALFQQTPYASTPTSPGGEPGLELIFWVAAGFLMLATLHTLSFPAERSSAQRIEAREWRRLFAEPAFVRALVLTFLAFLVIQGPTVLFPILVRDQGGGIHAISQMWILMLMLEVPLVYHFGTTLERFGARGLIAIGLVASGIRWSISGFADDLGWVYAVQILHGVTVWGVILGAPLYVNQVVPPALRSTGQGVLAMLGVSLGSMLSNLGAGWLTEAIGARAPAQIGGLAALALAAGLPWLLPAVGATPPASRSLGDDPLLTGVPPAELGRDPATSPSGRGR